jgi:hypothetical protein
VIPAAIAGVTLKVYDGAEKLTLQTIDQLTDASDRLSLAKTDSAGISIS